MALRDFGHFGVMNKVSSKLYYCSVNNLDESKFLGTTYILDSVNQGPPWNHLKNARKIHHLAIVYFAYIEVVYYSVLYCIVLLIGIVMSYRISDLTRASVYILKVTPKMFRILHKFHRLV